MILVEQVGLNIEKIKQKVETLTNKNGEFLNQIWDKLFVSKYNSYKERYFIYNASHEEIPFSDLMNKKPNNISKRIPHEISSLFYEGFGNCI